MRTDARQLFLFGVRGVGRSTWIRGTFENACVVEPPRRSARFSTEQIDGLRAIADLPRFARRVLVYLGERSLKMDDGIEVWPFDRFARAVAEGALWP